jgi:ATP synthase protein I
MSAEDPNSSKSQASGAKAMAIAWTLPFTLVVPMVLGGGLGFFLDRWLHTKPALLLILGLLGLGLGIRDTLKAANSLDKTDGG